MGEKLVFVPNSGIQKAGRAKQGVVSALFQSDKQQRKLAMNQAQLLQEQSLTNDQLDVHAVLHQYELSLVVGRGANWNALQVSLGQVGVTVHAAVNGQVKLTSGKHTLGHVYLGDARFQPIANQPINALNTVHTRRGGLHPREYVLLATSNQFVRRYVVRGISLSDAINLTQKSNLAAPEQSATAVGREVHTYQGPNDHQPRSYQHPVQVGQALTNNQQILSHTRGWSKRFISTGVSNRTVFSTQGKPFHSLYGAVVVDLAFVPETSIFDIHRNDLIAPVLGFQANSLGNNAQPTLGGMQGKSLQGEKFLALRDVVRTRELLIKGQIARAALIKRNQGTVILAVPSSREYGQTQAAIEGPIQALLGHVVNQDHLNYALNGIYWHVFEFDTVNNCQLAFNALAARVGRLMVKKYTFDAPPGML